MKELLRNLSTSTYFIPHGHCYLWNPGLVWLHVLSDGLTAIAYYSIPLMLLYFASKRKELPFSSVFWLFGAFIAFCGTTHLMEIWTLWHPVYWLSGTLKAVTALFSLYTAAELFPLIPQAITLPSHAELEVANQKLAREAMERQQTEIALKDSEAKFRSIFEGASIGIEIIDLTGQTVARNPALQQMLGYTESLRWHFPSDGDSDRHSILKTRDHHQIDQEYLHWERDYYQMEKRYLCKDGHLLWCHVTGYLVRDSDANPQFGIRMVEDITAHKRALKELQNYQERLEDLVVERTAFLSKVNEQLTWEATHDALTGLMNRREFLQRLEAAVVNDQNQSQQHTLCYLDLDRFKIVNDTCGHAAGDELLRQISTLLQTHVRQTDLVARLGGDEFALLLYNCPLTKALQVAHSLQEAIQTFRFLWQDKSFSIGASMGMVSVNNYYGCGNGVTQTPEKLLNAADAACYKAKNSGRNRIHVYQPDDRELSQQQTQGQWVNKICQAIGEKDEAEPENLITQVSPLGENRFSLYYQPIVALSSPQIIKEYYEILLRLIDEKGEVIPPMAFLPAAERYNLMPTIDRWVIRQFFGILAQQEMEMWNDSLYTINLSTGSVNDKNFIEFLQEQFSVYPIRPETICFEIAESVAIASLNKVSNLVNDLKVLGCQIALDDFGDNISSFSYLKDLPFDYLKITGDLIRKVSEEPINLEMIKTINKISHMMGMQTIAKFVANNKILEKMADIGIDYVQGYEIAPPRPLRIRPNVMYQEILLEKHYC